MLRKDFILLLVMLYTLAELIGLLLFLRKKKYNFLAESVIVYAALTLFLYCEYRAIFYTPAFVLVLVLVTVLTHSLLGNYVDLYHKSKTFDRGLHLVGAFSFALLTYSIINNKLQPVSLSKLYVALFVAALGMALGVVFEIAEYIHDVTTNKPVSQHGLKDTDTDLIFNTVGSVLAGAVSVFVFL